VVSSATALRTDVARRAQGFTLLESLVVLAIAGLLLTVVPIAFQKYRESSDYRNTVRTMTTDLSAARQLAIAGGRDVAFSVDLNERRYGIEGRTPRSLPQGLEVRVTVADVEFRDRIASIRFHPGGNATGGSVEIVRASGTGVRLQADWLDGRVSLHALRP
jgi:general secretion pathway protein H